MEVALVPLFIFLNLVIVAALIYFKFSKRIEEIKKEKDELAKLS